jgi:hypothetical protein
MIDTLTPFRAVQENATSFCMDWPVFEFEESGETHFNGTVFVLDATGNKVSHHDWSAPSDQAADDALCHIGWTRTGPWETDAFGRHSARVVAIAAREPIPLPSQRTVPLAEEAALHFA